MSNLCNLTFSAEMASEKSIKTLAKDLKRLKDMKRLSLTFMKKENTLDQLKFPWSKMTNAISHMKKLDSLNLSLPKCCDYQESPMNNLNIPCLHQLCLNSIPKLEMFKTFELLEMKNDCSLLQKLQCLTIKLNYEKLGGNQLNAVLKNIAGLQNLQELSMEFKEPKCLIEELQKPCLAQTISNLKNLESLSLLIKLQGTVLKSKDIQSLIESFKELSKLRTLRVKFMKNKTSIESAAIKAFANILSDLKNLRQIEFYCRLQTFLDYKTTTSIKRSLYRIQTFAVSILPFLEFHSS